MSKVLYEGGGRIGRITLNRPEVMNEIDDDLAVALTAAVAEVDADPDVHAMFVAGTRAVAQVQPMRPQSNLPVTERRSRA